MKNLSLIIYASLFLPFLFAGVGIFKVIAMIQEPHGQLDTMFIWIGLSLGIIMWILESRLIIKLTQKVEVDD